MKLWHVLYVQVSAKAFQSLYTLLGFNENERRFTTMPYRIRCTPAINAFMTNLPQVLDNNFAIGKLILLNTVLILQKIPFPPRYATTWQHAYTLMQEKYLFQVNFSQICINKGYLWLLFVTLMSWVRDLTWLFTKRFRIICWN